MEPDWEQWASELPGRTPRSIMAVPALGHVELRGRRVIAGIPGTGWRGDLRADNAVVHESRTYIPVLTEQEWYRVETDDIEAFGTLLPAGRVWLERYDDSTMDAGPRDLVTRLVSLDAPPRQDPIPAGAAAPLSGRRVVRLTGHREDRDLRAVSEPHTGAEGDICVRVAAEADWYRWGWTGVVPQTHEVALHLLWVE